MKREDDIDKIFRAGITESSFENKDALWQRIEKGLDKEPRKKRPLLYFAVLLCLVIGGMVAVKNRNKEERVTAPIAKTELVKNKSTTSTGAAINEIKKENTGSQLLPAEKTFSLHAAKKPAISKTIHGNIITHVIEAASEYDYRNEETDEELQLKKNNFEPEQLTIVLNHATALKVKNIKASPPIKYMGLVQPKKYSIDLLGGTNIASFKKTAGFYAGISVNKHLKNNAAVSAALLYSASNLSEKYRLSSKPDYNKETDAVLNKIRMLQLNLQLRQQVNRSKLFLSAGLMPVYILDAAFDNLPSSDSSNPALYRRFTLKDINRLNVLFAAGARYQLTKGLHAEITGTYGLTGLVKDSYINQSNLKGNFKNIQLGLVYKLQ